MLKLGEMQDLVMEREKEFGVYLSDGEGRSVLLPRKYVPEGKKTGDTVNVFLYKDSEDRWIATTRRPLLLAGEIGRVRVSDVSEIGAFVDIGLEKEVLLPHREMRYTLKKGQEIEVYLYVDKSERLCCTSYTRKHEEAKRLDQREVKQYHYEENAERLLKILQEKFDGHVPYTDKTVQPEQTSEDFGMSKAAFKRAIGKLLKDGRIKITKSSIFCVY